MESAVLSQQPDLFGYVPPVSYDGHTYRAAWDYARLTNNLQRVLWTLLDGRWHSLGELRRIGGSAADSRVRDLRKSRFGAFTIQVVRSEADPDPWGGVWCYRIEPWSVTKDNVKLVMTLGQDKALPKAA